MSVCVGMGFVLYCSVWREDCFVAQEGCVCLCVCVCVCVCFCVCGLFVELLFVWNRFWSDFVRFGERMALLLTRPVGVCVCVCMYTWM